MSGPAPLDIEIYQGDTFELPLRLRSINADNTLGAYLNLTGYTLKAQIRDTSDGAVLAEFAITLGDQTNGATVGTLTVSLSHLLTAALAPDAVSRWDLQYTDTTGKVRTLVKGAVSIPGEITE